MIVAWRTVTLSARVGMGVVEDAPSHGNHILPLDSLVLFLYNTPYNIIYIIC